MMLGQRLAHLRPVRGMRDCWNGELRRRRHIENTMEMVVKLCGYRPVRVSVFWHDILFVSKTFHWPDSTFTDGNPNRGIHRCFPGYFRKRFRCR